LRVNHPCPKIKMIAHRKGQRMRPGMIQIPSREVDYHPLSYCDPNGRLFTWQGQLYRGIKGRRDFYYRLFHDGTIQRLIDKRLLVQTELTNLALDGYDLVLRHHSVPFVSYPDEWCADMLKDATLLALELLMELALHGLTLQDANPWNVLFDGYRPVYVDLCSIVPIDKEWPWDPYDDFNRFFLNPLQLMAQGYGRTARLLLRDGNQVAIWFALPALIRRPYRGFNKAQMMRATLSVTKQCYPHLIPDKVFSKLHGILSERAVGPRRPLPVFFDQLWQKVAAIPVASLTAAGPQGAEGPDPMFEPSTEWTVKYRSVQRVLSSLCPPSVLEVCGHRGWYSQFTELHGCKAVALDVHEGCVAQLYCDAKAKDLRILPLVMKFASHSPTYGRYSQRLAPTQRLRCDMILALELVHQLVFKQLLNFEQITEDLFAFSNRWALVEFILPEDQLARKWRSEKYPWYTLESFVAALGRKFQSVKTYPSFPDSRLLLLCEK